MGTYKTPGVYVEEISTLPASVAAVETAIPAFIGYTAKTNYEGKDLVSVPTRISSLLEYQQIFGGAPAGRKYTVELDADNNPISVSIGSANATYYTYDSVRLFYANGGGDCYIVSTGDNDSSPDKGHFTGALAKIARVDEPTLLVFPDAVNLDDNDLAEVQVAALKQCADLQDRFSVLDVRESSGDLNANINIFRNKIGINNLKYGGAYTPYIKAGFERDPKLNQITLERPATTPLDFKLISGNQAAAIDYYDAAADLETNPASGLISLVQVPAVHGSYTTWEEYYLNVSTGINTATELDHYASVIRTMAIDIIGLSGNAESQKVNNAIATLIAGNGTEFGPLGNLMRKTQGLLQGGINAMNTGPTLLVTTGMDGTGTAPDYNLNPPTPAPPTYYTGNNDGEMVRSARPHFRVVFDEMVLLLNSIVQTAQDTASTAESILASTDPVYSGIVKAIKAEGFAMPPSGAVVGVYASVDRTRGVWKAPANVSINGIIGLTESIDNNEQQSINVDVTSGKSINAIRKFTGKGILIWGARTLAGNDNEWRYVPVRRLYIMAEESIKKATEFVVFEPNDANTWIRVRSMIANFLTGLWRDGALAGAKPDDAFFVKVGLGETMTAQDILEGRMIVEIGMAAVRPAEFIILRFMHKLQES